MATKTITAAQSLFSARLFNIASIVATIIAPLLMVWIAISIFVYSSVAYHPNPRTVYYNRISGYRFYGASGTMVVFGQPINSMFHSWHGLFAIWLVLVIAVVPWGIWDIIRAGRENWQDLTIEVENS
ncbi:MAG: hypothetical protein ACYCSS_01265 [Sulfuriferula sp.]